MGTSARVLLRSYPGLATSLGPPQQLLPRSLHLNTPLAHFVRVSFYLFISVSLHFALFPPEDAVQVARWLTDKEAWFAASSLSLKIVLTAFGLLAKKFRICFIRVDRPYQNKEALRSETTPGSQSQCTH